MVVRFFLIGRVFKVSSGLRIFRDCRICRVLREFKGF